jgi:hypothetical protein
MSNLAWSIIGAVVASVCWVVLAWHQAKQRDQARSQTEHQPWRLQEDAESIGATAECRHLRQQLRDADTIITGLYAQIGRLSRQLGQALGKDQVA